MYLEHYRFRDRPFKSAHDPDYYYAVAHQVAANTLLYSIEERQGLATLIGEPGTGKTTLLRGLLSTFGPDLRGVLISGQLGPRQGLLGQIATALEVSLDTEPDAVEFVFGTETDRARALVPFLYSMAASGNTMVILIDEAQDLTDSQFQEVRYLTNLEIPGRRVVEVIMAGQPSLEMRLATPQLAALRQRIAVRSTIAPLSLEQTEAYIEFRLQIAGAQRTDLFTADAVHLVHERSQGVPRLINVLCDRALVIGYADDAVQIDLDVVQEAIVDLQLDEQESTVQEATQNQPDEDGFSRMDSRLRSLEEKVDILLQALTRAGFISPEHVDDPVIRRRLESLGRQFPAESTHELQELLGDQSGLPPTNSFGGKSVDKE